MSDIEKPNHHPQELTRPIGPNIVELLSGSTLTLIICLPLSAATATSRLQLAELMYCGDTKQSTSFDPWTASAIEEYISSTITQLSNMDCKVWYTPMLTSHVLNINPIVDASLYQRIAYGECSSLVLLTTSRCYEASMRQVNAVTYCPFVADHDSGRAAISAGS
jgi:hypothetical protein